MSQAKLQAARELIEEKEYEAARSILVTLPDDPTAIKWLARIDKVSPPFYSVWEYCVIRPGSPQRASNQVSLVCEMVNFSKQLEELAATEYVKYKSLPREALQGLQALFWKMIDRYALGGWEIVTYKSNIIEHVDIDGVFYEVDFEALMKRERQI